jgi:hypothetical protein
MAKKIKENFNSIAVFLCLLVFHARSIKQKSVTLKIQKTCFAIWIFYAMSGYRFHFFMTTWKKKFFFEKKVGPTNVWGLFFYTEGFRSTLSMLWRIEEYVMYQVFMQIPRYLCQIWLIVRWGSSSPPALAFWSKSRIRLYLPPLYRPLAIGFFQKKFEILKDGKVLTFGCQTGIEVGPKILFLIFYFFFIFP